MISMWIFVLMHHTPVKSIGYVTDGIDFMLKTSAAVYDVET